MIYMIFTYLFLKLKNLYFQRSKTHENNNIISIGKEGHKKYLIFDANSVATKNRNLFSAHYPWRLGTTENKPIAAEISYF